MNEEKIRAAKKRQTFQMIFVICWMGSGIFMGYHYHFGRTKLGIMIFCSAFVILSFLISKIRYRPWMGR